MFTFDNVNVMPTLQHGRGRGTTSRPRVIQSLSVKRNGDVYSVARPKTVASKRKHTSDKMLIGSRVGNIPVNWPKLLLLGHFQNCVKNFLICMCSECHST